MIKTDKKYSQYLQILKEELIPAMGCTEPIAMAYAAAKARAVLGKMPEKIDIVDWSNDPATFVAAALSPAVVSGVQVISEKNQTAIAFIHDDQLSLAIGKEGQNARLAAKLTGWKIGIESEETFAKKQAALKAQQEAAQSGENSGN